ncbi:hypothetical protein BH10ACT3_BH10ACT3_04920 [soil metagenome]
MAHPSVLGQPVLWLAFVTARDGKVPDLGSTPLLDDSPWIAERLDEPALIFSLASKSLADVKSYLDRLNDERWVETAYASINLRLMAGPGGIGATHSSTGLWQADLSRPLDETDHDLIRLLRSNGRASYTALADTVGLSTPATRRRVLRLVDSGVIRFTTVVSAVHAGGMSANLMLRVDARHRADILTTLTHTDGAEWVAEITGPHDISCSVNVSTRDQLEQIVAATSALPGVLDHDAQYMRVLRNQRRWSAGSAETTLSNFAG